MKHSRYAHLCPLFQAAMEVLARPWNGLIMATLRDSPPLRFSEVRERLSTLGDRMLSFRLKELEARGLVVRQVCPGPPVRVTYALTDVGRGFREVEQAISSWGGRMRPAAPAQRAAPRKRSRPAHGRTS